MKPYELSYTNKSYKRYVQESQVKDDSLKSDSE